MTKQADSGTTIVITMAGRGSRFREVGYTVPKYEIVVHGHSLFYWSMLSLKNFIGPRTRVVFVSLAENASAPYIREQCAALGIDDLRIIELEALTDGQATSALASRSLWLGDDSPLLIYNIDTFVQPFAWTPQHIRAGSDGWIPCFQVAGDHWSFVKINGDGWATDVAEKQRISDYASVGLYWFARAGDFVRAYDAFFADPANLVRGERYVAPLYRQLLADGARVSIADLNAADVHALGTPAEVTAFSAAPAPPAAPDSH
jgi:dTDP-glucose pyrophosphorylase